MFGILFLLFTLLPALELYLLFKIGAQIGGLNTILIIILTGALGAILAKSQGLQILYNIQKKADQGELPGDQIIQGFMVLAGGLLLLTPGFLTDIFGFSLVLPGSRHILLMFVRKLIYRSIRSGNVKFYHFGQQGKNQGESSEFYSYSKYNYTDENSPSSEDDSNVIEVEFTKKD